MWIDITRTIGRDTLVYPGDRPHRVNRAADNPEGDRPELELGAHTGTHLDAPAHFIPGGRTLDQIDVERFSCPALVIDGRGQASLPVSLLNGLDFQPGDAVLFKTDNANLPRDEFSGAYTQLSAELAERLAELRVNLVGIDYLSVDPAGGPEYPAHAALLGAGVLILEDCDLRDAPAGRYQLFCLPIKLDGTDGAPCRALLKRD
ncbi:cyclase family protein [bacterium]|nr:cyclase family protein [bacterium]